MTNSYLSPFAGSYRVYGEASLVRIQRASRMDLVFVWTRSTDLVERAEIRAELARRDKEHKKERNH
jgi:hypothetical protein